MGRREARMSACVRSIAWDTWRRTRTPEPLKPAHPSPSNPHTRALQTLHIRASRTRTPNPLAPCTPGAPYTLLESLWPNSWVGTTNLFAECKTCCNHKKAADSPRPPPPAR
eukprot:1322025-Pyramimonas_sp.AAC.1